MGNAPAKLGDGSYGNDATANSRGGSGKAVSSSSTGAGGRITFSNAEYNSARTRRGTSLVGSILGPGGGSRAGSEAGQSEKRRSTREREETKESHARQLVTKFEQTVDGGFLAPYGCYGFEKLDYDADVVKTLIIDRQLAPFYLPLQDFNESWTREELIKIVDGLPLHAAFDENLEKYEDIPVGNLRKQNFDGLIDKTLSKREQRRMRSKIFKARLYRKRIIWQEVENEAFLEQKIEARKTNSKAKDKAMLPSDDLKYSLYKKGIECPICFLYYPEPLNYSSCCQQPICTECFVQIKRAEPHFPHDEVDPAQPVTHDEEKDPNLLTSEAANCAYCATPNFGVIYRPREDRKVGIGGSEPSTYTLPEQLEDSNVEQRAAGNGPKHKPLVVASDMIRPDWKMKLDKERARLAKRSANATAIHVSHRLIDPDHPSRRASAADNSNGRTQSSDWRDIHDLEEEMLERAIRLSIADQNEKSKA
ncbi:hypothetical protein HG536_0A03180 [Torulaspora globosa]|uniref:Protein SIP5 n=1 Tax=Torulaspora globosa TaxID=48254 RepID=A0A7G3ZAG4_9SACH|nr:uncharacterized protein HG536_0A03180 [Torulaspora globosa]QLL30500.1 hypothetical protein HG536_0A03180 [Torulaspora globosa]